jgi:hypothetical protein
MRSEVSNSYRFTTTEGEDPTPAHNLPRMPQTLQGERQQRAIKRKHAALFKNDSLMS